MKFKKMIALVAILGLTSNMIYGQSFSVSNLTHGKGIYILFNQGAGSFPSGCTPVTDTCCKFSGNQQNFSLSGHASFNISANQCGSSGYAQAEFTLGATDACGTHHSCDIVNISTVQGPTPNITITPSSGSTINSKQFTCGVYGPGNPNCAKQQSGQGAKQCPANNFCTLNYYGSQTYTVSFQ